MNGFLAWIESSALGHFMRESGPWTYAVVNLAHILGIATLFGSVLVLDLALIRRGTRLETRRAALPALAELAAPVAAGGFFVAAATGIGLLSANATEYQGNPFFLIKFPVIALGVANAVVLSRSAAWRALGVRDLTSQETTALAWMGAASLVCWVSAIAAGRMIGYW